MCLASVFMFKVDAATADVTAASGGAEATLSEVFTMENWGKVPVPTGINCVDITSVLASKRVDLGGRVWLLEAAQDDDIAEILAGEYEVKLLDEKETFERAVFEVDADANVRYRLIIISKTATYPIEAEDEYEDVFCKIASYSLITKLKDEEAINPIIQALRLDTTFDAANELFAANPEAYKKGIGATLTGQMLHFVVPEKREMFAKMIEAEAGE